MELIAHRAGNDPERIPPAAAATDTIEVDIHLFRGRAEVRHEKVIWPFEIYWEQWELRPDAEPHALAAILRAAPPELHVWLDLKGFTSRLAHRVLAEVGDRRPLTASTRMWWTLGPMRRAGRIRTFRSVGSRWQLWLVRRFGVGATGDGIVMHERFADAETVAALRRVASDLVVWAVVDLDRALELAETGVTGLILDDVDLIREIDRRVNRPAR